MPMPAGTITHRSTARYGRSVSHGGARFALLAWLVISIAAAQAPEPAEPPTPVAITDAPEPAAQDNTLAQRDAAQETFLRLTDEKRYDEAVTIAGQIVELTARMHGQTSIELAAPLVNLATAQLATGDLTGAETNYQACMAIIERADGIASPRLVNPLVGLGETYMRGELFGLANEAYRRALRVNHVAAGFYNPEQTKILDGLSESYLGLDKLTEANAQQQTQVAIQRRRSGDDSAELAAALFKLGRWYNRTGQYPESREAYQAGRRVIRETKGDTDPALVDGLLGEALSYENEGAIPASASVLKRALDLLDSQPEKDLLKRAEVLVALGDLYTLARQPRSARQRYGQAWHDLSGNDSLLAQRDRYFDKPSIISSPRLPRLVEGDGDASKNQRAVPGNYATGVVLATLTVTADGDAEDAVVVESDPPGLLDKQVIQAIGATAFRPRLADGAGVASPGVQFRHEFRYPRPRAAEAPAAPASGKAGAKGEAIGFPGASDEPDGKPR